MNITCYVIDDEPLAVELMESYIRKTPFLELKGSFGSGVQAFEALQKEPVDLLLCDIQMPGLTGMELSRMLPERTRIIFTTAFSSYALEGYKVQALDYLLKPVSYDDFLAAAGKARQWFEMTAAAAPPEPRVLFVKTDYRLRQIDLDEVLYIEGMKDYVKIHLEGQDDPVVSLMSLKSLMEKLPEDRFFRVSKSYIVQMSKIRVIEKNRIVFGNTLIPISEQVRDAFFRRISLLG